MATAATEQGAMEREVPITCDPADSGMGDGSHPWMYPWMFRSGNGFHGPRFPPPPPHHDGPPPFHGMHGDPPVFMGPRMNELSMHLSIDPRPDPRMDPRMGMDPRGFHGGPFHHPPMRPPFGPHPSSDPRPFGRPPPPFGPPSHLTTDDSSEDHHRCPYMKDWWKNTEACPWMKHRKDEKEFKVSINVSQFTPEDLNVSVTDQDVRVQGRHEERKDSRGFISREFTRRYQLPDDVDPSTVKSSLGQSGMLSVFAPRKLKTESSFSNGGHEVPIEIDPAKSTEPATDNK
ncbi:uncharacterized protein [Amphiura filiformis]|uniref:uncharacterized protein n=1 Tax=Amphiura filiformis TaxID=82378 RepID=UPI003B20D4FB